MKFKDYGYRNTTPEDLQHLLEKCAGKPGDSESETSILDSKAEGFVEFISNRGSHVVAVIKRCGSTVLRHRVEGDTVFLHIAPAAFRGVHYSFRNVDSKAPPMSKEEKEKIWGKRGQEAGDE